MLLLMWVKLLLLIGLLLDLWGMLLVGFHCLEATCRHRFWRYEATLKKAMYTHYTHQQY